MKSKDEFHPIDKEGNELTEIKCCFDGQGTCSIKIHQQGEDADVSYSGDHAIGRKQERLFTPKVLFRKGAEKKNVNQRLIDSLQEAVLELSYKTDAIIKQIEAKLSQFKKELETPFVPENIRDIALESVEKQLQEMKVRRQDCKRLERSDTQNCQCDPITCKKAKKGCESNAAAHQDPVIETCLSNTCHVFETALRNRTEYEPKIR